MKLAFIIVLGMRWHFRVLRDSWSGMLSCPDCACSRAFLEKRAFKAFTLYWWPLFRTEEGGHVVECMHCQGRFYPPEEVRPYLSAAASSLSS